MAIKVRVDSLHQSSVTIHSWFHFICYDIAKKHQWLVSLVDSVPFCQREKGIGSLQQGLTNKSLI